MRQYETFEMVFPGPILEDAWAAIDLTAEFTCGDTVVSVKGFYDGEGRYMVRFLPQAPGIWHWQVTGCVQAEGEEVCGPAAPGQHGLVKAVGTHFEFEDGGIFFPVGTTVYALAHQPDALVEETLETLKHAPFNKVRMCVFPKHYDYNSNEPPAYPFEKKPDGSWDAARPCIAFWHRFEDILLRLFATDIQVDLILFHPYDRWGFASMSREENHLYLDYLIRRLAAYPSIWWSLANEYDLCFAKTLEDWYDIEEFVASQDPYHHLLSCHNCFALYGEDRPNCTHASLQVKSQALIPEYTGRFGGRPIVIDETCYEGNLSQPWGCLSPEEMTARFWRVSALGGYCTHGETYKSKENDVIWWAAGGKLVGGSIPRIRFMRQIFEELVSAYGPLEGTLDHMARLMSLSTAGDAEKEKLLANAPNETTRGWIQAIFRQKEIDRFVFSTGERFYQGHCGDRAFITYYDQRCCGFDTLDLPEEKHYTVEVIDTWDMTRTVVASGVTGRTEIQLPGKPAIAVICRETYFAHGRNTGVAAK